MAGEALVSTWIVLLEAAPDIHSDPMGADDLRMLIDHVGADAGLQGPERYALQMRLEGSGPIDALVTGVSRWEDALAALTLPKWELVRTEVFTPEELEAEYERDGFESWVDAVPAGDTDDLGEGEALANDLLRTIFLDPLTGLGNERALRGRLEHALARARRTGARPALLRLDLDGFDAVNRRFGHTVGDQVLLGMAHRLAAAVRPGDVLGRLGGDEFGILLEESSEDGALVVCSRVLAALRAPFPVAADDVRLGASVGVAVAQPGQSPDAVLQTAAAALRSAKHSGGNCFEVLRDHSEVPLGPPDDRQEGNHDRLSYLLLMQRAATAANESAALEEAAEVVLRQVCAHSGWPVGHLYVVSPDPAGELVPAGVWHLPANDRYRAFRLVTEATRFPPGVGLPGRVLAAGEPLWIADLAADPEERWAVAAEDGLHAAFAFPILAGREVVAVLEFLSPERTQPNGSLLEVLAGVGTQLGRVVERSRARQALEHSHSLLREAQELGVLGSWHTDVRRARTTWSDELYRILGLDPSADCPGLEAFLAVVHPEDRDMVRADGRRNAVMGGGSSTECRILRPDGEVRWVVTRSSQLVDEAGDLVAVHTTVQDITDHKRAAECSLTCEVRWHLMLQGSQENLLLLSEDGTVFFALTPVGVASPLPPDSGPTALIDAVHPDDAEVVRQVLAELLADPDSSVAFAARFPGEDGHWRWFDSIASNLLDEPLIGAIVVNSLDVTEWKRLQEQLTDLSVSG